MENIKHLVNPPSQIFLDYSNREGKSSHIGFGTESFRYEARFICPRKFLKSIFEKMRGRNNLFDLKLGFSVEFRVE